MANSQRNSDDWMAPTFNRLRTIPGLGKTSGLVILYEVDTIERFQKRQKTSVATAD